MNTNTFALSSSSPAVKRRPLHHHHHHLGHRYGDSTAAAAAASAKSKCASRMPPPNSKFSRKPLSYLTGRLSKLIQKVFEKEEKEDDSDLDELAVLGFGSEPVYRKQQELDVVCSKTAFTKQEVKLLYWGWKVACPDGILNEFIFKDIYAQFFPQAGDSALYAHFVFNAMFGETLAKSNGQITFFEYVRALSALCRGTLQDKIQWIFTLYDINRDGRITFEEVLQISIAIYALLGFNVIPAHNLRTYEEHARKVFHKLDTNGIGYVTFEQFNDICLKDETIFNSMQQLDISTI